MESRSSQNRPQIFPPSRDFSTTKHNKRFAYGTAWSGWERSNCIRIRTLGLWSMTTNWRWSSSPYTNSILETKTHGWSAAIRLWSGRETGCPKKRRDWVTTFWCCTSGAGLAEWKNPGWIWEINWCNFWSWSTYAPTSMSIWVLS